MIYAFEGVRPEIADTAWIAPGAQVMGRVRLLQEASIWFNAVLRGDNEWIEIGPRSNVQEGAVMHTDPGAPLTIGADVTIGHGAILHGCSIGDGALIGMGAIVLNRAVIPAGALVGAGALVTEGKTFEEGALIVGSPARAKGVLEPQQRGALIESATNYVQKAARFRNGLQKLA